MRHAIRADDQGSGAVVARASSTPPRSGWPCVKVLTVALLSANAMLGICNRFLSVGSTTSERNRSVARAFSEWGKIAKGRLAKGRHSPSCVNTRGRNGSWVPDRGYDYDIPIEGERRRGRSKFSPATRWTWKDDDASAAPKCPFDRVTMRGFCRAMRDLDLDRIFFVGDSLSFGMATSLWKLLGQEGGAPGSQKTYIERRVRCGDHGAAEEGGRASIGEGDFAFAYTRNDYLQEAVGEVQWKGPYTNANSSRTLLVANTGLHIPSTDDFERSMKAFIDDVVTIKASRPDDVIVFRTSVPGHVDCGNYTVPFGSAAEYVVTTMHRWDEVGGYNDVARRHVAKWTAADAPLLGSLYLLDVYPMTLLRPDGHRSPPRDCLHYALPGPPDWWNHLLYNMLLDLGAARSQHSGLG